MASRHSAARPKRDGENFARTHHHEDESDAKRVKFDVRNPSALAPDAREDDAILDADVIGGSNATKRGAVNLDGYDSDSDNDTFNARAGNRKKGDVNILDQLDNYDAKGDAGNTGKADDDDDDDDMFAPVEDEQKDGDGEEENDTGKKKRVQFMETENIQGQEQTSKSGGTIRLDDAESSDDEEEKAMAMAEEGVDDEVGAGGLKRNAPKVEAFNLNEEMEGGQFDDQGNYVRKAGDPDAVHDSWLDGLSKKDMKKAKDAHEQREAAARKQRLEDDEMSISDLLKSLILQLEKAETPLEALARLGKGQVKTKKVPKWKLKKMKGDDGMDVDKESAEDPEQARIKAAITAITESADRLLSRDYEDIYDQERELLVREYRKESGEEWIEPAKPDVGDDEAPQAGSQWEFRWVGGRGDGTTQGPYDGPTMKAWQDAGYFGEGVEFRAVDGGDWTTSAAFV